MSEVTRDGVEVAPSTVSVHVGTTRSRSEWSRAYLTGITYEEDSRGRLYRTFSRNLVMLHLLVRVYLGSD